jgi:hypothetical protein
MAYQTETELYEAIALFDKFNPGKSGVGLIYDKIHNYLTLNFKGQQGLGGIGITKRLTAEIDSHLPGLSKRLERERGKIVFIGNGVSISPTGIARKYAKKQIDEKPIIVDVFDYFDILDDLNEVNRRFFDSGKESPVHTELISLTELVYQIRKGNLEAVRYFFGSGEEKVPETLKDSSLVINCNGPPITTLDEQLTMLKIGGELYANLQPYHGENKYPIVGQDYKLTKNDGSYPGFIIRREK